MSATTRWNGFQAAGSSGASDWRAAAADGASSARGTSSPRDRLAGSGYQACGAWKLVSAASTPREERPIQVPPAWASRGPTQGTPPGVVRRAQPSAGRPSRSSRLAATTTGQRRSTPRETARVHMRVS